MPVASAKTKSKVDTDRATAQQLQAQLKSVTAQLANQEAKSASARQAAAAATSRFRTAQAEEVAVTKRLDNVRKSARQAVVSAYVHGGNRTHFSTAALAPAVLARADYYRSVAAKSATNVEDELMAARQDLAAKRKAAESASQVAARRKKAVGDTVDALRASRNRQLKLAAAAESRYSASLKASQRVSRSSGGRPSVGRSSGGRVSLTTVRGITVATSIAGNLERMLDAASGSGFRFGGSGYRSSDGQVAARRKNCGTSQYATYNMPPSQCHPPTARPGTSMHEQGLAIDFTYNGSLIQGRSNAGYQWLSGHAAGYGFYNLPSEAWHWSVNGN